MYYIFKILYEKYLEYLVSIYIYVYNKVCTKSYQYFSIKIAILITKSKRNFFSFYVLFSSEI